jgi:hypothetical protein
MSENKKGLNLAIPVEFFWRTPNLLILNSWRVLNSGLQRAACLNQIKITLTHRSDSSDEFFTRDRKFQNEQPFRPGPSEKNANETARPLQQFPQAWAGGEDTALCLKRLIYKRLTGCFHALCLARTSYEFPQKS